MGAGLGPATAFLYSGPAINALAIILTARILGWEIGLARAIAAVGFALIVGALMAWIFHKDEKEITRKAAEEARPLWQTATFFAVLVAIQVMANWGSDQGGTGFFAAVHAVKWPVTATLALLLAVLLRVWHGLPAWRIGVVAAATAAAADRLILLVMALGSPAAWGFRQWERSQALSAAVPAADDDIPRVDGDQVVMTYFTSGVRCRSCREIERLSHETATGDFSEELSSQRLVFRVIDTDEPANAAFVARYQLISKNHSH
jgi:hypothetical protein